MKFIKWKSLILTCLVCLLPITFGLILWDKLPDTMAIHFNINNEPDNFASKQFVVFILPAIMMLTQIFCCFINDFNSYKHGERKKFEAATKWIIPVMCIILQSAILLYGLGKNIDMRKMAMIIVGIVFLVIGNYLPKFDYIKNYDTDTEKARKINRFIGIETVVLGVIYIISAFLPPVFSIISLILLIPYTLISVVYGIKTAKK